MAKQIVTQEHVNEAADVLVADGEDPSIVAVQARIGGGSYTTVKRYLDVWREQRARTPAVETPAEIAERGSVFVRELWAAAAALAEKQTTTAREAAQRDVEAAQKAQKEAEAALERVEQEVEGLREQLAAREETLSAQAEELINARAALGAEQARNEELQRQVQELRVDIERRQTSSATEYERLAGEVAALRAQMSKLLPDATRE